MKRLSLALAIVFVLLLAAAPAAASCQYCTARPGPNSYGACADINPSHPQGRDDCSDPCKNPMIYNCDANGPLGSKRPIPPEAWGISSYDEERAITYQPTCKNYNENEPDYSAVEALAGGI